MMNKLILLLVGQILSGICNSSVFAQKETDNWIFGRRAGLNFTEKEPTPLVGSQINQIEGIATISDPRTGQLLFYSDGLSVWDRSHQVMPNGQSLLGSRTSTQSALIVPFPGKKNLYYLFTTKAYNDGQGGLYYSLIDVTLNNGLGDVVSGMKNRFVESRTTEKLTAIPLANKRDFWILSHIWDTNEFLVYLLSPTGLILSKKIAIGTVHKAGILGGSEAMGYLKASPNGKLLAAAVFGNNRPFELYDFDNKTGEIYNYRSLGDFSEQYGVSFSPDNTKLYLSALSYDTGSYQFNLNDNSMSEITLLDTVDNKPKQVYISGSLQLGINGKLYAAIELGRLAVIQNPNLLGQNCNPTFVNLNFGEGQPLVGLPNFIQTTFDISPPLIDPEIPSDSNCTNSVIVYPNPIIDNHVTVDFGSNDCILQWCKVFNVLGQLIFSYPDPISSSFQINTTAWSGGQYYFIVLQYNDRQVVKKILKL